jgi:hypothetical protein
MDVNYDYMHNTPSVSKYLSLMTVFLTLIIHLIQKIIANM